MSQPALLSRIHALYASTQRAGAAAPPELKQLVAVSIRDDATSGAAIEALAEIVLVSLAGDRL